MSVKRSTRIQPILDRLLRLENSQNDFIQRLQTDHEVQMSDLRERLIRAERMCAEIQNTDASSPSQLSLIHINTAGVEAALQAAISAEQDSASALVEAKKVVDEARRAVGTTSPATAFDVAVNGSPREDHEYIIKTVLIDLDNVERVMNNSSYVSVCRAFGLPDPKYGNEVYCVVAPKKGIKVSEPMLFIHAQKFLPAAQVPKRFFLVSDLPAGVTRQALADTQLASGFAPRPIPTTAPRSLR